MAEKKDSHAPGWGIQILGDPADIAGWKQALQPAFDPYLESIEGAGPEIVLRSGAFDQADDATAVREIAKTIVRLLNGALAAVSALDPVRIGNVIRVKDDGTIHATAFGEIGPIRFRPMTAVFTGSAIGPDGAPLSPPPPEPSQAQRWLNVAERDDDVADLLDHYGRARDDWFEVYKTLEVEKSLGKRHGGYKQLLGDQSSIVEDIRLTANAGRHWRKATHQPSVRISMADALPVVGWVVSRVMEVVTRA